MRTFLVNEPDCRAWKKEDKFNNRFSISFRYQGQYEDKITRLYNNRFRYYGSNSGTYISQDPIGLGRGYRFYSYVHDVNSWIDWFGLNVSTGAGRTHVTYQGINNGKPYTGYARTPSELGLSPDEIVSRMYGDDFF